MGCNSAYKLLVRNPRQHISVSKPVLWSRGKLRLSASHGISFGTFKIWNATTFPTSTCCRVRFARTRMFPHGRPAHFLGPAPPRPPTGEQLSVEGLDSDSEQCSETVAQRISSAVLIACGRLSWKCTPTPSSSKDSKYSNGCRIARWTASTRKCMTMAPSSVRMKWASWWTDASASTSASESQSKTTQQSTMPTQGSCTPCLKLWCAFWYARWNCGERAFVPGTGYAHRSPLHDMLLEYCCAILAGREQGDSRLYDAVRRRLPQVETYNFSYDIYSLYSHSPPHPPYYMNTYVYILYEYMTRLSLFLLCLPPPISLSLSLSLLLALSLSAWRRRGINVLPTPATPPSLLLLFLVTYPAIHTMY